MLRTLYLTIGAGVLVMYAASAMLGWELGGRSGRQTIDASVRSAPGGYRAFHFWHSGYHGGK